MARLSNADFEHLLEIVRNETPEQKERILYWTRLAHQRRRFGKYVYVHANAPSIPYCLHVYIGLWGRTNNQYHNDVLVGVAWSGTPQYFGVKRLWRIMQAADPTLGRIYGYSW